MGIIASVLLLFVPCFIFVYNLTAAICRGIKEEGNDGNLFLASLALCAIVVLVILFLD